MISKLSFFLAFYLPFQIALNPTDSIDLASIRVIVLILALIWLFNGLLHKELAIPVGKIPFFIYTFIFLCLFSVIFAQEKSWALRKVAFILSLFPIYIVFFNKFKDDVFRKKFYFWLVLGSFFASLVGILQFFLQFIVGIERLIFFWGSYIAPVFLGNSFSQSVVKHSSWLVNVSGETIFRSISTFPDPHMFSFYMGMTAPLALVFFIEKKNFTSGLFFSSIFVADLLSFSRGGYFGLLAGLLFFSLVILFKDRTLFIKRFSLILFSLLICLIVLAFSPFADRFLSSFNSLDGSNYGRLVIWKDVLQISLENPWGVGIGNLPLKILPSAEYRDPIYAHNLYLDISSETGLLSLISFLAILILACYYYLRRKGDLFYLGAATSLIVFSFHSLTETPLYSAHILTLFFIILSLANENILKKSN